MANESWQIKLLFDGDCPLCSREVDMLRRRNSAGRVVFEDIAAPEFDPSRYQLTQEEVMGHIHGVLPSGEVVRGMEVFRRAYAGVGLGWVLAPSRWRLLAPLFDRAYRLFARNRLRWTGRGSKSTAPCPTPADNRER